MAKKMKLTPLAIAMREEGHDDTSLGGLSGVSASSISNYRRGKSTPRVDVALVIAKALNRKVTAVFPASA